MASIPYRLRLLRGLVNGEVAYVGPNWLGLDVTRRCNNTCLGCRYHSGQGRSPSPGDQQVKDLPAALVRKICQQVPGTGTSEVVLVGEGEPFLHPQLFDFISDLKAAGFKVQVFTNGTLLDEARVRGLMETAPDMLNVTFWAINEHEHHSWHPGVPLDYLERRTEGVRRVIRAQRQNRQQKRQRRGGGPIINLQFPLTRQSFTSVPERVELARNLGSDAVTFGFFRDWGGPFAEQGLLPEDIARIRDDLLRAKRALGAEGVGHNIEQYLAHGKWGHQSWKRVPCYAGWYETYVKVDGTVKTCDPCNMVMGNLLQQDFEKIWNSPRYRRFRRASSSLKGLDSLQTSCECANCCLVKDNLRVHRIYRHLAPVRDLLDRVGRGIRGFR